MKFAQMVALLVLHGTSYFGTGSMVQQKVLFGRPAKKRKISGIFWNFNAISAISIRFSKFLLQSIQRDYS
jgi:hypothetical protein